MKMTHEWGMKKGTSWKRVFIHTDGKLCEQAHTALTQAGIPTYENSRKLPGHSRSAKIENWIFAPRDRRADAEQALANAGLIEL